MKILTEIKNPLLKRKEIVAELSSEKNPGFEAVQKMLAEKLKVSADNIVMKNITSRFGKNDFKIKAFAYDSLEDKALIEPKKRVKKAEGAAQAAPGAKK